MEMGTLAKWLAGFDPIAEIETDKATMEIEATDAGRVVALVVPEGSEDVPVGTLIARIATGDAEDPESHRTQAYARARTSA